MAQLVTVKLNRYDSTPWGFRLQGGKDFGTPLLIQKVNGGSIAEQAGLAVGDGLIKVNGQDVFHLRHKDAQDAIVRGGNSLELQVQRGGSSTWKPIVTNIGSTPIPTPHVSGPPPRVTKTSLAANKYPGNTPRIGSGHNINPKPFNGVSPSQINDGTNGSVKAIVNKQYNTPVGMYSEETIAETLSAQAEVLAGGVLGVNFMKNEKNYNAEKSEVFKMVQEADKEPKSPELEVPVEQNGVIIPPPIKGLRHVSAPENKPVSPQTHGGSQPLLPVPTSSMAYFATSSHAVGGRATSPRPLTPMAQQIASPSPYIVAKETILPTATITDPPNCSDCGKIVVGVFVRIKDKNLHVECFKCATCGTSLKNVGYYNINDKLYCDIHAKMIARQNPPAPNVEPVTVSPGGRIPSNVISNAINSAVSPKPNSISSPFQVNRVPLHVSSPKPAPPQTPNTSILSPKSFNGTSAPLTPPISTNFSRPQTEERSENSCKMKNFPLQSYTSSNGLCPAPLPSAPGYILPAKKLSSPVPDSPISQKSDPSLLFASLPSASQVKPGTNCLSPAPLPSVPGYVSPKPTTASPPPSSCPLTGNYGYQSNDSLSESKSKISHSESRYSQCSEQISEPLYSSTSTQKHSECLWSGSSREISRSDINVVQSLSNTLETQLLLKTINETGRCPSPLPPVDPTLGRQFPTNLSFTNYETQEPIDYTPPVLSKTSLPSFFRKPTATPPLISFPPEFPPLPPVPRSRSATPSIVKNEVVSDVSDLESQIVKEILDIKIEKPLLSEVSKTQENKLEKIEVFEPLCQKKYIAEVKSSVKEFPQTKFDTSFLSKKEPLVPTLPTPLSLNPPEEMVDGPATVPLPPETVPYFPPSSRSDKPEPKVFHPEPPPSGSPFLFALTTAPARSFSPLPSLTKPPSPPPVDSLPDFQTELPVIPGVRPVSMLAALTVASERPYSPIPTLPPAHSVSIEHKNAPTSNELNQNPSIPSSNELSQDSFFSSKPQAVGGPEKIVQSITSNEKIGFDIDSYSSQKPENKGKQCVKIPRHSSPSRISFTNSGLHKPCTIPPYQQQIAEIPFRSRSRSPQSQHPNKAPEIGTNADLGQSISVVESSANDSSAATSRSSTQIETKPLKPSVKSFLEKSNVDSEVVPILGYQPNSAVCSIKTDKQPSKKVSISDEVSVRSMTGASSENFLSSTCNPKSKSEIEKSSSKLVPLVTLNNDFVQGTKLSCSSSSFEESDSKSKIQQEIDSTGGIQEISTSENEILQKSVSKCEIQQKSSKSQVHQKSSSVIQQTSSLGSQTCCKKVSISTSHSSSVKSSVIVSSSSSTKSNQICSELTQSKSHPVSSTKACHMTCNRLSPLAISDIPADSDKTSAFCKTASGSQLFKPAVLSTPIQSSLVSSKADKQSVAKTLTKQTSATPPVSSPISNPKTVSQSATSAFSVTKKTNGSVASNLSKTLTAKIAANNINESKQPPNIIPNTGSSSTPNSGGVGGASKGRTAAGVTVPRRGRGVLNPQNLAPGARIPLCGQCSQQIRGPFITALGKIWCPDHFICVNKDCRKPLQDIGFVEEDSGLYCEYCFEKYLAPSCNKCSNKIKGDCLNAIGKHFHPECFKCAYCGKLFGNNPFFLEEGLPYCENDWNELFTTKCFACGFPIEAGDRWVEALNNNYHSPCFNCMMCKKNLEGESFFAKGGRPYCKSHAR